MRFAFALIPVVVLVGCKSSTAPGSAGVALWVANYNASTVLGYSASQIKSGTSAAPEVTLGTPSGAGSDPFGGNDAIAFDHNGNLWVAEISTSPTMLVMYTASQLLASANPTPAVTITSTVTDSAPGQANDSAMATPAAIAFDASGKLWVVNSNHAYTSLLAFTPTQLAVSANVAPAIVIGTNAGSLQFPDASAFDQDGNLWVANRSDVVEFSASQLASNGNPVPAVTLGQGGAAGLAFDKGGNLWVTVIDSSAIHEFAANQLGTSGNPVPAVTLTLPAMAVGPTYPQAITFDGQGDLWYVNYANTVFELRASQITASGSPSPAVTLSGSQLLFPVALAFPPS
jgi:sugar lactone lactonase YvrE